jgi:capsular exopolysaccharide synthesis family protein
LDLQTALRVLRAHWLSVLVATLVGLGAGAGWAFLQPRVYTADASGYVAGVPASGASGDSGSALLANNLALSKVVSFVDIGSWRSVAEYAISKLDLSTAPEFLVRRVQVTNPTGTVTIRVEASGPSPEAARDLSEAWLQGMATEIASLETSNGRASASVELVPADTARLPTAPSSPNVRLALLLGAGVGLLSGLAFAFARYTLDRRIRSADVIEKETGLSVVGTVPIEKSFSRDQRLVPVDDARTGHLFAVSEAMRELRTNVQFMDVDHPPRVVVVTSPVPGDGKSTVGANLALVTAASGKKVYFIDGDLRRPMVGTVFGLVEGAGLTDVLSGRARVSDVEQSYGGLDTLSIIAAGRTPPNPSEVLGSDRMRELLSELSRDAMVIIDAPPLLPVTDAAVLAHVADGAIIVVSAGRTTFETLKKAIANLERAGGRALGVVLNRLPRGGGGYYDYRYSGDYYASEKPRGARKRSPAVASEPTGLGHESVHASTAVRPGAQQPRIEGTGVGGPGLERSGLADALPTRRIRRRSK